MAWFHPKTLLDKTYEIGILIKGVDGFFETVAGLFLLIIRPETIGHWTRLITQTELEENPHNLVATHVLHYGQSLAHGRNIFAIAFLLTHGIIKLVLVVSLLRAKMWAYPFALITLGLFVLYQVYELIVHATFGMGFLTVLDLFIIWLVWREWQQVQRQAPAPTQQSS
ncbi:MAG: DUF2127 domain-containing protein [Candidatus Saccharibacteria bacterium]